jgi:hypothetical protein
MKILKWAAIVVIGFVALRWLLNIFAAPAPPNIADGSIYPGWGYAGPLYAVPPRVYAWSPRSWGNGLPRGGPRPWRGQSYAGRG